MSMNRINTTIKNKKILNRIKLLSLNFIFLFLGIVLINSIFNVNVVNILTTKILNSLGIYTEEIISVGIESSDYQSKTGGSWHIDKSAMWTGRDSAKVTFHLNTVLIPAEKNKDIILVLDISGSMVGDKIDRAKSDAIELINYVLEDTNNRIALVTFSDNAEILSNFTNDKNVLTEKINEITAVGETNYNAALQNVNEVMNGYIKEATKDVVTLFLTDGYPSIDTPNQISTYKLLKDKYPYMSINGVQYEMGTSIIKQIEEITDYQYAADQSTLNNILFEASVSPKAYEKFEVVDYIEKDYFYINSVDDIEVTYGEVKLEEENGLQKITWNLGTSSFLTGKSARMYINLKLKEDYLSNKGYYPTNNKERVTYKLLEGTEKTVNSSKTPVLKNNFKVTYNTNPPIGCNIEQITEEEYFVYENVTKRNDKLSCDGYLFKGWEVVENVTKVNDEVFLMPGNDVNIRGTWTKQDIAKSMDGTVYVAPNLYNVVKNDALNNKGAVLYTGNGKDTFKREVYYYNGEKTTPNNYVKFGGFCWKIVRTTDTGGVKLVYNGLPQETFKTNPIEENEYINVTNDTEFEYKFDKTTNKWISTNHTHSRTGTITFSVATPGEYAIEYTVSSESGYDNALFYKDGTEIGKYSGSKSGSISLGTIDSSNVIMVKYTKDSSGSNGTDTVEFSLGTKTGETTITCDNSGADTEIGESKFNEKYQSPAYVGYMYNEETATKYSYKIKNNRVKIIYANYAQSTNYYYGDTVEYDGTNYILKNNDGSDVEKKSWRDNYSTLTGYYTCTNNATTCPTAYYVLEGSTSSYQYALSLTGGKTLDEVNTAMKLGSAITKNGDGTYTLNEPVVTITKSDWVKNYNTYLNYYMCSDQISTTCEDMHSIVSYNSSTGEYYYFSSLNDNNLYGNSFDYENGKYKLKEENSKKIWDLKVDYSEINNKHYTCFNETGECETLSYVYYYNQSTSSTSIYYINLNDGKSVEDALNEMLWNNNVNDKNSAIKNKIDTWYENNMTEYTDKLEDTIFCNDRSIYQLNGWDPNEGDIKKYLYFGANGRNSTAKYDLTCTNKNDSFTMSESIGNGKLKYPVGLLTKDEVELIGKSERTTGENYWLGSPYNFSYTYVLECLVYSSGNVSSGSVNGTYGVRPAVSLKPGTLYSSGSGSATDPYIVD